MNMVSLYEKCKNDFRPIAKGVYCLNQDDIDLNTIIYKYIDLSALIDMLNGNYRVKLRRDFKDQSEHGKLENPFIEHLHRVGYSATKKDRQRLKELEERRGNSKYLMASCFTYNTKELHALWNLFTEGSTGIRIKTTIGKFINCLQFDGYEIFIGRMNYVGINWGAHNYTKYLFTKNECYEPEQEVRFYFVPKNLQCKVEDEPHVFPITDCKDMISEIVLSPFIPHIEKGKAIQSMKNLFSELGNGVRHSIIMEKN